MKTLIINLTISILLMSSINASAQNNVIEFDGNNSDVNLGNVNFPISNEFTVMVWVKWNINPATGSKWANMVTCNADNSGDHGRWWLQHNSNNHKFEFAIKTTSGRRFIFSSTNPQQGVWYHIAATFDGSQMKLFVNGVLENTKNHGGTIIPFENNFETHIGGWANSNNNYRRFAGDIDNVSIWNKALDVSKINQGLCGGFEADETGLISYYNMDNISGNTLYDVIGNNNGSIHNSTVKGTDNNSCGTLPVEFVDVNAKHADNEIIVSWSTASEINNDYFTIEKSTDGNNFYEIATIEGQGFSNELINYSYIDTEAKNGSNYYRIKQTDYDGKMDYSELINVNITKENNYLIYPNPVNSNQKVNIQGLNTGDIVQVYDLSGKTHNINDLKKGYYIVKINGVNIDKLIVL